MKKPSIKSAKAKAWKAFSIYIRTKYSKDGICECFTCGVHKPIKEMQASHGVGSRCNGVLFLEEIVRPCCYGCNVCKKGNYEIFIPKLIELYGFDGYQEFVKLRNKPKKYTIPDLQDIEKYYKEALNGLS